jgi:hypothetical protein
LHVPQSNGHERQLSPVVGVQMSSPHVSQVPQSMSQVRHDSLPSQTESPQKPPVSVSVTVTVTVIVIVVGSDEGPPVESVSVPVPIESLSVS